MIESKLTDLLEQAGERTTVGPPPIDAMHARVTRRRRRRTVAVSLAAAVAVIAAAGGTAVLVRPHTSPEISPPIASTSPGVAPTDLRLFGIGHAAIAVPKEWGMNQTKCLTPQRDTVVLARDPHFCAMPRPVGVESVDLGRGKPSLFGITADQTIEIDGVRAERRHTTCTEQNMYSVRICSGGVRIPSLDTWFWAESSTSAEEVDRILERITIVPNRVGVPHYQNLSMDGNSAEKYADMLRELGLKSTVRTIKSPSYDPGQLMGVSPVPGTMLPLGATVTLTVVATR
jgi:hypothetical protein